MHIFLSFVEENKMYIFIIKEFLFCSVTQKIYVDIIGKLCQLSYVNTLKEY